MNEKGKVTSLQEGNVYKDRVLSMKNQSPRAGGRLCNTAKQLHFNGGLLGGEGVCGKWQCVLRKIKFKSKYTNPYGNLRGNMQKKP